jgi:hypothetical protein
MNAKLEPDGLSILEEMFETLAADAQDLRERVASTNSAEARRSYVRSVFALVEGIVFALKHATLARDAGAESRFSLAELTLLKDEVYELTDDGEARSRMAFLRPANNLRFAVRCFTRSYLAEHEMSPNEEGWAAYRRSIRVRNRLMHPKKPSELVVEDHELADATQVMNWFAAHVILLLVATVRSLQKQLESLSPGEGCCTLTDQALEKMAGRAFPHVRIPPRTA